MKRRAFKLQQRRIEMPTWRGGIPGGTVPNAGSIAIPAPAPWCEVSGKQPRSRDGARYLIRSAISLPGLNVTTFLAGT